MRVVKVEVLGHEYELVYTNRVMMRQESEKWDMETTAGLCSMLSAMMEAGDRLAELENRERKGFLTVDDLADRLAPHDLTALIAAMGAAQTGERNVETADDPKNAGSTPPEG